MNEFLATALADHRGYVNNHITSHATGSHCNSPGHSLTELVSTGIQSTEILN